MSDANRKVSDSGDDEPKASDADADASSGAVADLVAGITPPSPSSNKPNLIGEDKNWTPELPPPPADAATTLQVLRSAEGVGSSVDRYKLLEEIGVGGMGM